MVNLSIIGSSKIAEDHIRSALKNNIKIICLFTTNRKSKNISYLQKKYQIKNIFINFNEFLKFSETHKSNYLICPRIKDNKKFLIKCLKKTKSKVMVEKPLFLNSSDYKSFYKFNNRIFICYNRIFYKNINYLKNKINNKKNYLSVVCPEKNRKSIVSNSCHIISILCYLFKNLKVRICNKLSNIIEVNLYNKKNLIKILFSFNNNENFKIETFNNKNKIIISPIEKMKIFNNLRIVYKNNIRIYEPNKILEINENDYSNKCKPGFFKQMKNFKMFVIKNKKIYNDLKFGHEVIKICNRIVK